MHRIAARSFALIALVLVVSASRAAQVDPPPPRKHLLIIAPAAYHEALMDFVAFKQKELWTDVVELEEVLATTEGVDDPERIKRFLYDRWRAKKVDYALLVGDADVFPVRYMVLDRVTEPAFDYAFYPSDLYYSDLARSDGSFDDWNARKDDFHAGYFGEVRGEKNKSDPINFDQIDYRPDIAVGRWPVSSVDELTVIVKKSIRYESAMKYGNKPGRKTVGLFACGGWVDGRGLMDSMAAKLPDGWTAEKRYYADDQRNDNTPPPDAAQAVQLLNSGAALLVHIGHGEGWGWAGSFTLNDMKSVTNADRLPIMISAGCSTAVFASCGPYEAYIDVTGVEHTGTNNKQVFSAPPPPPAPYQRGKCNPTSMGEQLLRAGPNGAVAYIGCNTGGQPCALTLVEGFMNAIGELPRPRLGDCWMAAIRHYYDKENLATITPTESWYPASIFFQGMKYMVFGDPSLPMCPSPK